MGKIASAIIGVGLIVVGAITGNWQLIITGVSMVGSAVLTPKMKQQQRQAAATTLQFGEVPRQAVFGTAGIGGSYCNGFNYGGKYGTDWEVLVIALADHECEALVGFYVNDKYVAFTGDGAVTGYNGQLEIYWRPGTEAQTIPAVLTAHGGYAASDNGAGVCYVVACYKSDDADAKNPVWPSGRPRFLWVLKGLKCYDPRLDSSVSGGSGAHDWANPATRTWTENVIVNRYNWVRGIYACNRVDQPDMLLIGRGLTEVEAPPVNVAARANLCDEPVALTAGGTEARYRCGGIIQADEDYLTVEEFFASACGGVITQPEGCVEIEPGQARSPTFFFTDDDLIVGSEARWDDFLSEASDEWVNTVIPRYVEPAQRWADHAAPIRRSTPDIIADGGPREQTMSLPIVTSATQAGRVGEIGRRLGRLQGRGSVTLGPRFCEIEEGDWGVWTSDRRFGGGGRTVRCEAWSSGENGHMMLQLRQISASCYSDGPDFDDGSIADDQDPPPAIGAPEVGSWTLSAEHLDETTGLVPGLVFIGSTADDRHAHFVRLEYWMDDGATDPEDVTNWTSAGIFGPDVTRYEVPGTVPLEDYYGAVSYVVDGVPGDRLILGPVTALESVLGNLISNFDGRNDRNGAAIPTPTMATDGTAIEHALNKNGTVDIRANWGFPGDPNSIDGYEFLTFAADTNALHTPGTLPTLEHIQIIPAGKLAAVLSGMVPSRWHTLAVRAYRDVDPDIAVGGKIYSSWKKSSVSSENPYRPSSSIAIDSSVLLDGVSAGTVALAVGNFNTRNDRLATTPPTATTATDGSCIDHVITNTGLADITFEWGWSGNDEDIDYWETMVRSSTSSATYVPGTSPLQEQRSTHLPNTRALIIPQRNPQLWHTIATRPVRVVDPDVNAAGVIYGAWKKSTASGENPYRPSANLAWNGDVSGTIDGTSASNVATWSGYAQIAINPDGTIKDDLVGEGAIIPGSINLAGYVRQGSTYNLTVDGEIVGASALTGGAIEIATFGVITLNISAVFPYEITVVNPVQGTEYYMDLQLEIFKDTGSGFSSFSSTDNIRVSDIWHGPSVSGYQTLGRKIWRHDFRFSISSTPADWALGWRAQAGPNNRGNLFQRYIKIDNVRSQQ